MTFQISDARPRLAEVAVTGTDGARYPCRHPPIASATAMRVTVSRTQTERKPQDRSIRRTEERGRRAFARPQTPLGAKKACSAGGFRRSCDQASGHLGNVGWERLLPRPKSVREVSWRVRVL